MPLESIVLETDAPDMPPAWLPGRRNAPAELRQIAEVLAELRGLSLAEIATQTSRNAKAIFPGI
ncbi:MAG: hypothetical protein ACD_10C00663G0001 [uncultured bacterium]|nr:MAG: hypothetical protein ACD_10C00663G0001 [uncultured bacterium]